MKATERSAKRNLSALELEAELRQAEEKRFKLAFNRESSPLSNPMELRNIRRQIARMKTWISEKKRAEISASAAPQKAGK